MVWSLVCENTSRNRTKGSVLVVREWLMAMSIVGRNHSIPTGIMKGKEQQVRFQSEHMNKKARPIRSPSNIPRWYPPMSIQSPIFNPSSAIHASPSLTSSHLSPPSLQNTLPYAYLGPSNRNHPCVELEHRVRNYIRKLLLISSSSPAMPPCKDVGGDQCSALVHNHGSTLFAHVEDMRDETK